MTNAAEDRASVDTPAVRFLRLRPAVDEDIPLPSYMTSGASGMDICAAIEKEIILESGGIYMIPTGFAVALPAGYEAQIRPRSGLAVNHGIGIINSPGTIDADYRGEVKVPLINHGKNSFLLKRGDRIAQMVIQRVCRVEIEPVTYLEKTERGDGGFGHTGL